MLKVIENFIKCEKYYEADYIRTLKSRKEFNQELFFKIYKEYVGKDYPKCYELHNNHKQFITEKPTDVLYEEIQHGLNELKKHKNDKRITNGLKNVISTIENFINTGSLVLNGVEYSEIDKSFMDGGDVGGHIIFDNFKYIL